MPLQATDLVDLVATTQRDLGKPNVTMIATDIQKFWVKDMVRENRVELQSGVRVQWDVMVNAADSVQNTGLGATDSIDIPDTTVQAVCDWRHTTGNYAFEGREIAMNREPARIVDLVRVRRAATMIGAFELMENNFFGPPVAASDTITPWGIATWIVKNASEGFYGGAPSGYTEIGLNPTTYERWKNYTALYTSITKDDVVRKLRKAARMTNFESPLSDGPPDFNTGDDMRYYSTLSFIMGVEEICESQNENLGSELAPYDGKVMFLGRPINWVPKLDADTTNPIYGINHGVFKTIVLSGWWFKQINIPVYPGQHTMSAHFMDWTYQWVCYDRRANFVLATGTTYPS